jgi:hypothetical protein
VYVLGSISGLWAGTMLVSLFLTVLLFGLHIAFLFLISSAPISTLRASFYLISLSSRPPPALPLSHPSFSLVSPTCCRRLLLSARTWVIGAQPSFTFLGRVSHEGVRCFSLDLLLSMGNRHSKNGYRIKNFFRP